MENLRQTFIDLGGEFQYLAKACRQAARLVNEIHLGDQRKVGEKVRQLRDLAQIVAGSVAAKSALKPRPPKDTPFI